MNIKFEVMTVSVRVSIEGKKKKRHLSYFLGNHFFKKHHRSPFYSNTLQFSEGKVIFQVKTTTKTLSSGLFSLKKKKKNLVLFLNQ